MNQPQQTIIIAAHKSMGVAVLLTIFFGPLGLFYATVLGGFICVALAFLVAFFTFGFGALIFWPLSVVWTMMTVASHNGDIKKQTQPQAVPVASELQTEKTLEEVEADKTKELAEKNRGGAAKDITPPLSITSTVRTIGYF